MDSSKKVFLSYRRALSIDLAGRIRDHLIARGYDVFFDVTSIPSGKFPEIILGQIEARPLFVPVLVPGCLARTVKKEDWFRREIEHALDKKRHIVPLTSREFSFETERKRVKTALPKCIDDLAAYHYVVAYAEYFEEAIERLVAGLLAVPDNVVIRPTPPAERKMVSALSDAAKVATPDALGTNWVLPPSFKDFFILSAPKLTSDDSSLTWTAVQGASGYVLERSATPTFVHSDAIYNGKDMKHPHQPPFFKKGATWHYRVKAKGGGILSDSPWSNVVEVGAPTLSLDLGWPTLLKKDDEDPKPFGALRFSLFADALPAPTLSATKPLLSKPLTSTTFTLRRLSWTVIEKADRYVLERDVTNQFLSPVEIYSGKNTSFEDLYISLFSMKSFYRVRAIPVLGMGRQSPWSNIVELE